MEVKRAKWAKKGCLAALAVLQLTQSQRIMMKELELPLPAKGKDDTIYGESFPVFHFANSELSINH